MRDCQTDNYKFILMNFNYYVIYNFIVSTFLVPLPTGSINMDVMKYEPKTLLLEQIKYNDLYLLMSCIMSSYNIVILMSNIFQFLYFKFYIICRHTTKHT